MHPQRILFVLEVCALTVVVFSAMRWPRPNPASAAFPGANGMIAFTRWVDGNAEVYVMNPDGSDVTRLTDGVTQDQHPDWQPLVAEPTPTPIGGVGIFQEVDAPRLEAGGAPGRQVGVPAGAVAGFAARPGTRGGDDQPANLYRRLRTEGR